MAKEIEKKYVIMDNRSLAAIKAAATEVVELAQGYLAIDEHTEVRVRRKDNDGQTTFVQTVKGGSGLVRDEVEFALTEKQFSALWPITQGRRIEKTRYQVPIDGDMMAEVDIYHGALSGHATVEVECPNEETASNFSLPSYFGKVVDVTTDQRYKNQQLATQGWPQ